MLRGWWDAQHTHVLATPWLGVLAGGRQQAHPWASSLSASLPSHLKPAAEPCQRHEHKAQCRPRRLPTSGCMDASPCTANMQLACQRLRPMDALLPRNGLQHAAADGAGQHSQPLPRLPPIPLPVVAQNPLGQHRAYLIPRECPPLTCKASKRSGRAVDVNIWLGTSLPVATSPPGPAHLSAGPARPPQTGRHRGRWQTPAGRLPPLLPGTSAAKHPRPPRGWERTLQGSKAHGASQRGGIGLKHWCCTRRWLAGALRACAEVRVRLALLLHQDGGRQPKLPERSQQPGRAHAVQRGVGYRGRRRIGLGTAVP